MVGRDVFRLFLPLSILFFALQCVAQGNTTGSTSTNSLPAPASVSTSIEPQSGQLGDLFLFTVTVSNDTSGDPPLLSGGKDFILSLIGTENLMENRNGIVTSRTTYNYRLIPKKIGQLETPAVEYSSGGEIQVVSPMVISVTERDETSSSADSDIPREDVFLKQSARPEKAFLGQQIVNTVELFTSVPVGEIQLGDLTSEGFTQETIGHDEKSQRIIDRKRFTIFGVKRALFPLRLGTTVLPSREMKVKIADDAGFGPFGGIFGMTQFRNETVTSPPLTVDIIPLPPAAPGLEFWNDVSPVVGVTNLSGKVDLTPIPFGQSKELEIKVTSNGNLNGLTKAPIRIPPAIKVYESTPKIRTFENSGMLFTEKTFPLTLIPEVGGVIEVPGASLSYFSPDEGAYKTARAEGFSIVAIGGPLTVPTPVPTTQPAEVTATQNNPDIQNRFGEFHSVLRSPSMWLVIAVGLIGLLWVFNSAKKPSVRKSNTVSARELQKRALGAETAEEYSAIAKEWILGLEKKHFGASAYRSESRGASELSASDLSWDSARNLLRRLNEKTMTEKTLPRKTDTTTAALLLLDDLENSAYSGRVLTNVELRDIQRRLLQLIEAIK